MESKRALDSCFDAFSSRETVTTSLENALAWSAPAILRTQPGRALGRADIRHEAVELLAQPCALARQCLGGVQHFLGGGAGFGRAAIDLHDVGSRLMGALGDALDAARDFLGRRALLLHRARNLRGD